MAKLFCMERIVPAWIAAVRELEGLPDRMARNFVLEISQPAKIAQSDSDVISKVDHKLLQGKGGIGVFTVAGTIFPDRLYRHWGRPIFYERFLASMKRGKDHGTWGTYALRMIQRTNRTTGQPFNPLDIIVEKLIRARQSRRIRAAYELGISEPADLLDEHERPDGFELPLYDPITDGGRPTNIPCLSHLSFKLQDNDILDLTAVYRSHYYAQRALGNLIGLSQLQAFVARESGLQQGVLTCVSTQARLDVAAWGGSVAARGFIKTFPMADN